MHCNKVSLQDCFGIIGNDLLNNNEKNALQEILNRIMQGIVSIANYLSPICNIKIIYNLFNQSYWVHSYHVRGEYVDIWTHTNTHIWTHTHTHARTHTHTHTHNIYYKSK